MKHHLDFLSQELVRRKGRNTRYSLRAFAAQIGLHPSALSRVLAGKQVLSTAAGTEIVKRLNMERDHARVFLRSILEDRVRLEEKKLGEVLDAPDLTAAPIPIDEDTARELSSLAAVSIVELSLTDDFSSDPEWIAERLGLPLPQVLKLIQTLLRVGMLTNDGSGLKKSEVRTTCVKPNATSEFRSRHQSEVLNAAAESLANDSTEVRGHYSMTMAIDPAKVPEANRRIAQFLEDLCDFLEAGERKEVYELGVQLFPLSGTQKAKQENP